MPSNRQTPDGWEQRQPCYEQDATPIFAEPAYPSFLGRDGETLCQAARFLERNAHIDKKGIDEVLKDVRAAGHKV